MKHRYAFTMIELIFVIVVMGIIAKFGTEYLAQAYRSFISTKVQDKYQNQSQTAVDFIAKRLQYRIKASVAVRELTTFTDFKLLEGYTDTGHDVLEWIAYDVEGLRSQTWSGVYDKNATAELYSPETNATYVNKLIDILSNHGASISDAAIYFIGSNSNKDSWGWDGVEIRDFNTSMKRVKFGASNKEFGVNDRITSGDFSTLNLKNSFYNSYQLSWTASAIVFNATTQQLWFYTDYQPWEGEKYTDANIQVLIMEEVSDFKKKQRKGIITIKVCSISTQLKDLPEDEFLTCKEKTIL